MHSSVPLYPRTGLASLFAVGILGIACLFLVFGGWAATTRISGAVVTHGQVGVVGKPKIVQSLEGGIIADLPVSEGDSVRAGQILARLDTTMLRADLDVARKRLAAALAVLARLRAEQADPAQPSIGAAIDPTLAELASGLPTALADQRLIHEARRANRENDHRRMAQSARDIDDQIEGVSAQITALRHQLGYLEGDLDKTRHLVARGALPLQELTSFQHRKAALQGDIAAREANRAALRSRQRQIRQDSAQQKLRFDEAVVTEMGEVTLEIQDLTRTIRVGKALLDRSDIRAPAAGQVHEIQVTTLGGVIAPGGTLLEIVPQQSALSFDLHVDPRTIDQVYPDQVAQVIISGTDMQNAPRLSGRVQAISPQAVKDPRSGRSFFRVALHVAETELARLPAAMRLLPGMPVEAFLHTQDRTVLIYLADPITAHLRRGFRE